jgi:hypothetical protein
MYWAVFVVHGMAEHWRNSAGAPTGTRLVRGYKTDAQPELQRRRKGVGLACVDELGNDLEFALSALAAVTSWRGGGVSAGAIQVIAVGFRPVLLRNCCGSETSAGV